MMESRNNKTLSFADLIRQYNVEVPIIQRDYAQGRNTPKAKTIREKFVNDLLNCLVTGLNRGADLELAFVYGHIHNGIFVPVDGQQRLTTLFLLYLYLVKRCMKESSCLACKYADVLARFTYATRQSAREFCEEISSCKRQIVPSSSSQKFGVDKETGSELKDFIREQPWFFVEWGNDPTIVGMLEVLQVIHSQVNEKCKDNNDKEKFLHDLLELLYSNNCPIRFHFLDMGQNGLSDDIYLKMNARGLPLDDFERFKSDLEEFLKDEHWAKRIDVEIAGIKDDHCSDWERMAAYKRITWKLDKTWGDEFWGRYNTKSQTMLMRVIARYFYVVVHTGVIESDKYSQLSAIADGNAEYVSFEPFSVLLKEDNGEKIVEQLSRFLDNITRLRNAGVSTLPCWIGPDAKKDILNPLNIQERVVFAFISLWHFDVADNKTEFGEWMRVVWNIVGNGNVEEDNFGSYIQLFQGWLHDCTEQNRGILSFLADLEYEGKLAPEQVKQECKKAVLLTSRDQMSDWLKFISTAESKMFFHGDIAVQIAGDGITPEEAAKRQELLATYIQVDTPKQEQNTQTLAFVKALIRHLNSWEELYGLFGHEHGGFSLTDESYHRWTRSEIGRRAIVNALYSPKQPIECGKSVERWKQDLFSLLVDSDILDNVKSGLPCDARIHFPQGPQGHCYLHRSYDRNYYYLLDTSLYAVLAKLATANIITIADKYRPNGFFQYDPIPIGYGGKDILVGATDVWIDNSKRVKWFDGAEPKTMDKYLADMTTALARVINPVT